MYYLFLKYKKLDKISNLIFYEWHNIKYMFEKYNVLKVEESLSYSYVNNNDSVC